MGFDLPELRAGLRLACIRVNERPSVLPVVAAFQAQSRAAQLDLVPAAPLGRKRNCWLSPLPLGPRVAVAPEAGASTTRSSVNALLMFHHPSPKSGGCRGFENGGQTPPGKLSQSPAEAPRGASARPTSETIRGTRRKVRRLIATTRPSV